MTKGPLHADARGPANPKEIGFWHDILDLVLDGDTPVQFDDRNRAFFLGVKMALGLADGCQGCSKNLLIDLNNIKRICEDAGGAFRRIDEVN